jgi:hypothetical protein
MGEAITGSVYQAKFGLVTANGQFYTGAAAGDFVIISQTGATIWGNSGGERMRLATNGNFGIGTTSPSYPLHVYSTTNSRIATQGTTNFSSYNAANTSGALYFGIDDSAGANFTGVAYGRFIYSSGAYPLIFNVNGAERLRIADSGNFGIGTTAPSVKFTVQNVANGNIALFTNASDADLVVNLTSGVTLLSPTTGILALGTSSTERIRINSSGLVGIGTSSPTNKLTLYNTVAYNTVNDQLKLIGNMSGGGSSSTPAYNGGIAFTQDATDFAYIRSIQTNPANAWTSRLGFWTLNGNGGTPIERMSIDNSGLVGIGTTVPLTALDKTLTVLGTGIFQTTTGGGSYNENLRLNRNTGNTYASLALGGAYNSTSGTGVGQWTLVATPSPLSYRFDFDYNGATKGYIDASSGVYVAMSDKNKKKDFEDSTIGLDAILGLKPTLYRMIDEDDSVKKQLGFIAQDVKDFIPQAYSETVDGFIGLQDRPIIAALVKAIQELETRLKTLENK